MRWREKKFDRYEISRKEYFRIQVQYHTGPGQRLEKQLGVLGAIGLMFAFKALSPMRPFAHSNGSRPFDCGIPPQMCPLGNLHILRVG